MGVKHSRPSLGSFFRGSTYMRVYMVCLMSICKCRKLPPLHILYAYYFCASFFVSRCSRPSGAQGPQFIEPPEPPVSMPLGKWKFTPGVHLVHFYIFTLLHYQTGLTKTCRDAGTDTGTIAQRPSIALVDSCNRLCRDMSGHQVRRWDTVCICQDK